MKKLALALVCLVSVAFFASCTPDPIEPVVEHPEPTIAIIAGEGYITGTPEEPQIISTDDTIDWTFGFHIESNAQTKKELSKLVVLYSLKGEYEADTTITVDLAGKTSFDYYDPLSNRVIVSEITVTATVTDVDGKVNTAAIAYKFDQPAMPLDEKEITWVRKGSYAQGSTAAEMAAVGLIWDARDHYHVNIHTAEGCLLYVFKDAADAFRAVTTDVEMAAYFLTFTENTIPVNEYREISVATDSDKEYNDVLATIDADNELHLILFERAKVEIKSGVGVTTTITGKVK